MNCVLPRSKCTRLDELETILDMRQNFSKDDSQIIKGYRCPPISTVMTVTARGLKNRIVTKSHPGL
jgi:hypothetical protein